MELILYRYVCDFTTRLKGLLNFLAKPEHRNPFSIDEQINFLSVVNDLLR